MKRRNRMKLGFRRASARAFVLAPLTFLLVAGAGCPSLFESKTQREVKIKQAEAGKDDALSVTAANTEVNVYAQLAGGADPEPGDTTITVTDVNGDFLGAVEQGDLLLIIQMAGATADLETNSAAYGAVSTLGSAGRYEMVGVEGVASNVITLACGLKNGYARAGKTQVIRVPQYTTVTIANNASITAPAWDGTTGGVVAVRAQSTVTLNGASASIDVSAKGFRGGAADNSSTTPITTNTTSYVASAAAQGGEKGEGIAGDQNDYDDAGGRYGRGAPANGGGGGTAHNAGGGGGANAASGVAWTGQGVMTTCTTATPGAWALDEAYTDNPAGDDICSNSQGGGRGGYSFSNASQNPTLVAPADTDWGGNYRRQRGGLGGRPVANSVGGANARLFVGGGGGAGDGDNDAAGPGGKGGGLVFLIAGSVAGTGSILANGGNGGDVDVAVGDWSDAAGGGGGGGTIVVSATTISAIAIAADGGRGGNHAGGQTNEAEGPGGGGGGGYVAVTDASAASISAAGGLAGRKTDLAFMSSFPENGATAGNAGVTNGSAAGFLFCGNALTTTIATHPDAITNITTGILTFTNPVADVTYECRLYTTTPTAWGACNGVDGGTGGGYTALELEDGSHTFEVRATDAGGNVEDPPATFTWTVDTTAPDTTIATKPGAATGDRTADFTFESGETPVTFECALDGATTWTACTATYTTPELTDGDHTLAVRAKDAAGNVDGTPATHEWNVNTGYPFTTIATHPNAASNDPTGDFTFTNTRDPVTYECRLDDGTTWTACDPSYTTPALDDGSHTLRVRATASALDGGVFVEDPPVIFTWTVDTVPPETEITSNPPGRSTSPTATFTFDSSEDPVTYECRIDGGDWAACTATFTTAPLPNGVHTLSVRSKDAAGNVDATPATSTWEIAAMVIDGGAIDGGGRDVSVGPVIDGGPPVIDSGRLDGGVVDGRLTDGPRRDGGVVVDGGSRDVAADAAAVADTRPPGAEPGPDAATVPAEPARDAAVNRDAPVANADAAVTPPVSNIKVLGGGFCAVTQVRTSSPAAFLLLALGGLALLRRKRR